MHLDDIDLTDLDLFQSGFPHEAFTLLDYDQGPGEMLNMSDPPQHTRLRRLVSKGFTPRIVSLLENGLRRRSVKILDAIAERNECDFLTDVAAELPLQATCQFMGIPQEDRHLLFKWTNALVDHDEHSDYAITESATEAALDAYAFAQALMEQKRAKPGDDISSALVQAEFLADGGEIHSLGEDELNMFFILLITAGAETTRNAIANGLGALIEHRDQLPKLRDAEGNVSKTAIEEILRWTHPVNYNRRTATEDVEIDGQAIKAGQKVTHWYPSLNRDESVFRDPFSFELGRYPNEHISFGHGAQLCLGASLARLEIKLMFEELFRRFTDIELAAEVDWVRTNKFSSVRHMPIRYRVLE